MNRKQWDELPQEERDNLASRFGLTRSGDNNSVMVDAELDKISAPEKEVKDEETKEKVGESVVEKVSKRLNRRRTPSKSKRAKK